MVEGPVLISHHFDGSGDNGLTFSPWTSLFCGRLEHDIQGDSSIRYFKRKNRERNPRFFRPFDHSNVRIGGNLPYVQARLPWSRVCLQSSGPWLQDNADGNNSRVAGLAVRELRLAG